MKDLLSIVAAFDTQKVLVIGDLMLDEYLHGEIDRISPEAPVPVVATKTRQTKPGGAANVALNVAAMGGSVRLIGLIGSDENGQKLRASCRQKGLADDFLVESNERRTTQKLRVLAKAQQVVRIDTEDTWPASSAETKALLERVKDSLTAFAPSLLILQDYDKGVFTHTFIQQVVALAKERKIPVTVDPKFRNFWSYTDVDLLKPNLKEVREALGPDGPKALEIADLTQTYSRLANRLSPKRALITLGSAGAFLGSRQQQLIAPTSVQEIIDVCGAGDSVIAGASLALAAGATDEQLLTLTNLVGGLACQHIGVNPVDRDAINAQL